MINNIFNLIRVYGNLVLDSSGNDFKAGFPNNFSNIKIKLYKIGNRKPCTTIDKNVNIETGTERIVAMTKTSKNGSFIFVVPRGVYAIEVDESTVPSGFGVSEKRLKLIAEGNCNCSFKLKKIFSIDHIGNYNISDDFTYCPCDVLKDCKGNIVYGHVDYSYDNDLLKMDQKRFYLRKTVTDSAGSVYKVFSGDISKEIEIRFMQENIDALNKIRFDYEQGLIENDIKIKKYIQLLFERDSANGRGYNSMPLLKSGTTVLKEIFDYISADDSDAGIVAQARQYIDNAIPKLDKVYTTPGRYFRIHYTTSGNNAVSVLDINRNGIPDYIEEIGDAFDNSRSITCTDRGFRQPVQIGDANYFDVYVYDLKGVYGITFANDIKKNDKSRGRTASSYICVDNNYSKEKGFKKSKLDCMRVTAAHEFFHAVQNAYNVDADSWWKEASATWNEDEIYHGVNDYIQYVGKVFSSPGRPLEKNSYSGVVFAKYLSENYGGYSMIKNIWETQSKGVDNSINAIDRTLYESNKDYNISRAFNQYTAYNYNPSQYYKEGKLWNVNLYVKNTFSAYPVAEQKTYLDHMAADYIIFKTADGIKGTLGITINTGSNEKIGFKLQKRLKEGGLCEISEIFTSCSSNRAEVTCSGFGDIYSEICLIPANLSKSKDNIQYQYSSEILQL